MCQIVLRISSGSLQLAFLSLFMLCHFFRKQCDERFPWLVLHSTLMIVRILIFHIDHVPILCHNQCLFILMIMDIHIFTIIVCRLSWCCDLLVFQAVIKTL